MATSTTYIHPSVSSTITDNSAVYLTADGTTKLYAVFTSEKGLDNQIQMITSVSEYEFNYGSPNIKLYGQVGYNIINWLNSGGVVYCLRVLPEDAGFANAIVNIQTKVSKKEVYNIDGDLVTIDDVSVRPVVSYTNVNNTSKSAIEINELRKSASKTIDGYTNNMLFAVIPKGRGKGYNNLGFRMSLIDTLDTTYDFRLYNFEVTQENENGVTSTIQGPFVVSLDPDAMSISGSSMFIKSVLEDYCDYFEVIFNEDNYEKLGNIINPNVNPNRIDFFGGQTRILENDVPETFYCPETEQEEDVHIYVTKYDVNHQPTSERNIVNADDVVEETVIGIDNAYRTNQYNRDVKTLERMKKAYSLLRKKTNGESNPLRNSAVEPGLTGSMLSLQGHSDELKTLVVENTDGPLPTYDLQEVIDFNKQVENLKLAAADGNESEEATTNLNNIYNEANNKFKLLKNKIATVLDKFYLLNDYCKVNGDTVESLEIATKLSSLDSAVYSLNNYAIRFASLTQKLTALGNEKDNVLIENNDTEKEEFLSTILTDASEIYDTLLNNEVEDVVIVDKYLEKVKETLDTIADNYEIITDENTIVADYDEAMDNCFDLIDGLITNLKRCVDLTLMEIYATRCNLISSEIITTYSNVQGYTDTVLTLAGTGALSTSDALKTINININLFKNKLTESLQNTYSSVLQNFNSVVSLLFGTDGSIEGKYYTDPAVVSLISKGYKGTIDDSITDKDKYQIDMILDANYDISIKNAIVTLTTDIRQDFVAILDTRTQATPKAAIEYRKNNLSVSNFRVAIFTQDLIVTDADYTGYKMQVTPTYFLASKIPTNDRTNGIHFNFVGPRRGVISGFESISFIPNHEWREQLYKAQVNYIEQDLVSTRFGSNLTSQTTTTALSNINNVRALLRIQREVEDMMKMYQFEYNDSTTRSEAQSQLSNYLNQWVTNRCCTSIAGSVYASAYDIQQRIMRVDIEMVFNSLIERIAINLIINN